MKISLLVITFTFFAVSGSIQAESAEQYHYKWKDEQGIVHYTERRPEPGIPFEKVRRETDKNAKSVPAPTTSTSSNKSAEQVADDSYSSWRKENCKIATRNLDVLTNGGKISVDDGEGGTRLMSDEEIAEKAKAMNVQIEKYCLEEDSTDN